MALKFYQHFQAPIKAISFDLDDTLYSNDVVIHQAEQLQFEFLCDEVPIIIDAGIQPWLKAKWHAIKANPELKHDVTLWRKAAIQHGLSYLKLEKVKEKQLVEQAFEVFYNARSNFSIDSKTHQVLQRLKEKFPIVAVTNGNADIDRLGLSQYFVGYYRAGANGNRMKPFPDMLNMVSRHLDIPSESILHVGDNIGSDLKSAQNASCSSFWYNPAKKAMSIGASLPNAEYSDLDDLLQLL